MVVGNRTETIEEKNKRHIKEILQDISAWEKELEYAKNKSDKKYETYCEAILCICENTLNELKKISYINETN